MNVDAQWPDGAAGTSRRRFLQASAIWAGAALLSRAADRPAVASAAGPVVAHLGRSRMTGLPLLGANSENTQNPFGWDEPNGIEATTQLTPAVLRFPGGSKANWYNWHEDDYYDLSPEEARRYRNPPNWARRIEEFRDGKLGFDDWANLVQVSRAEGLIVVNLHYPFDWDADQLAQDAAGWVHHVNVERGLGVKYWELGNEFYLPAYKDRYNDPSDPSGRTRNPHEYVDVASRAAAAMKAVDPDIQLIAVTGGTGRDDWNGPVADADFYDAIAIHPYTQSTDSEYVNLPPGETGAGTGDYEGEARWLFSVTQNQPSRLVDYVRSTFGDTPVWYTEWGIHQPTLRSNQFVGALHDADFILHTADHPETVQALLKHSLTNPDFGYDLYHYCREEGAGNTQDAWTDDVGKTVPYYVHEQLNQAINGASATLPVRLQNAPSFPGRLGYSDTTIEGLTARAWDLTDGTTKVAVVNKMGEAQSLQLVGPGAVPNRGSTQVVLAGPLDAIDSCDGVFNPGAELDAVLPTSRDVSNGAGSPSIQLPPYSFSMITMEPFGR